MTYVEVAETAASEGMRSWDHTCVSLASVESGLEQPLWQSARPKGRRHAARSHGLQPAQAQHHGNVLLSSKTWFAGGLPWLCGLCHGHQEVASQPCRHHGHAEVLSRPVGAQLTCTGTPASCHWMHSLPYLHRRLDSHTRFAHGCNAAALPQALLVWLIIICQALHGMV